MKHTITVTETSAGFTISTTTTGYESIDIFSWHIAIRMVVNTVEALMFDYEGENIEIKHVQR